MGSNVMFWCFNWLLHFWIGMHGNHLESSTGLLVHGGRGHQKSELESDFLYESLSCNAIAGV
jgi:hypothetical protein